MTSHVAPDVDDRDIAMDEGRRSDDAANSVPHDPAPVCAVQ